MVKTSLFSFFLLFSTYLFADTVENGMKQLPWADRINMKVFFDEAIRKDQAAHVFFFNNKPVCLTGPLIKHKDKTFRDVLALKGWHAFKKNKHLFPHPNFIFSEKRVESGKDCKVLDIYIINKQTLENCLCEHIDLFKKTLGKKFSPTDFISKLEQGQSLPSLLHDNELLLGILLGFGKESSKAFAKKSAQRKPSMPPPQTNTYQRIELNCPKGCKLWPVVFMGNPHSQEVKALISTYETELQEAWEKYHQTKNPLKMVLQSICEN